MSSNASFVTRICKFKVKGHTVIEEGSDVKSLKQFIVMDTDDAGFITRKIKYLGNDYRTVLIGNGHTLPRGKDGKFAPDEDFKIMTAPIDGSSREEEIARIEREAIERYKKSLEEKTTIQTQK